MLFSNVLIGFVLLSILAFMLTRTQLLKKLIFPKAEIMVVLDWDDMSADDVDLWIKGTGMNPSQVSRKKRRLLAFG